MRRLVGSEGYARARLVSATVFAALGAILTYRTLALAGVTLAALPGCVLGLAMVTLAFVRFRDYRKARRR